MQGARHPGSAAFSKKMCGTWSLADFSLTPVTSLSIASWFGSCKWRVKQQKKHMDLLVWQALFAPGRLEKSLRSCCIQFQSHLERLVFCVTEVVRYKSFLDEKQHCFENNICGANLYLHIGILSPWGSSSHGFFHSSHKQRLLQYEKKKRKLSNHIATARTRKETCHVRHLIKTPRTGNMVPKKPLLWKSHEFPILTCWANPSLDSDFHFWFILLWRNRLLIIIFTGPNQKQN